MKILFFVIPAAVFLLIFKRIITAIRLFAGNSQAFGLIIVLNLLLNLILARQPGFLHERNYKRFHWCRVFT